ncbi:hypothetical protein DBR45_01105 [Pseudomonas sp. HMWF031]|nr:hypothetical protein DBR45_01105 [Pseudomonas sp. HMWF031]
MVLTLVNNLYSFVIGKTDFHLRFFWLLFHCQQLDWAMCEDCKRTSNFPLSNFLLCRCQCGGYLGRSFWQHAHWLGVGLFIAGLLTVFLLFSLKLAQEAARQT